MTNSPRPRLGVATPVGQVLTGAPGDRQGITRGAVGEEKNTTRIADVLRGQW